MGPSVFKKTYYLGLSIILIPIIFFSFLFLLLFLTKSSDKQIEDKPKKEIVVETKTVIVRDTVYIKKPTVSVPVTPPQKINDTTKPVDTSTKD